MWSEVEEDMLATLLPFHRRIVEDLIKEDGLCILSSGMGWQKVVSCRQGWHLGLQSCTLLIPAGRLLCRMDLLDPYSDQ